MHLGRRAARQTTASTGNRMPLHQGFNMTSIKTIARTALITAAIAGSAMFGSAQAAAPALHAKPAAALNISLDGFCNTFALTVSGVQIYGTRGGCGYTVIDGGFVSAINHRGYDVTSDTNDGSVLFTWVFTKPRGGSGDWFLYGSNGSSQTLVNSGTYSPLALNAKVSTKDVTLSK